MHHLLNFCDKSEKIITMNAKSTWIFIMIVLSSVSVNDATHYAGHRTYTAYKSASGMSTTNIVIICVIIGCVVGFGIFVIGCNIYVAKKQGQPMCKLVHKNTVRNHSPRDVRDDTVHYPSNSQQHLPPQPPPYQPGSDPVYPPPPPKY